MARKKSLNDLREQLRRIEQKAGTNSERYNKALVAFAKYAENIRLSNSYKNSKVKANVLSSIALAQSYQGKNADAMRTDRQVRSIWNKANAKKYSQRTYMGNAIG